MLVNHIIQKKKKKNTTPPIKYINEQKQKPKIKTETFSLFCHEMTKVSNSDNLDYQ
jgi:hypothetical protein